MRSLKCGQMLLDFVQNHGKEIRFHGRAKDEPAHYCVNCEVEVFNILFVKEVSVNKHVVHCVDCARKISSTLDGFVVLEEYSKEDLMDIYDSFTLFKNNNVQVSTSSSNNGTNSITNGNSNQVAIATSNGNSAA